MNVVILGRPGAGKGTQAELLAGRYGWSHFSTGDLLRSAQQQDSLIAREISQRIDAGDFVTDELAMSLIEEAIATNEAKGYIFDGIPRNCRQAPMLSDLLGRTGQMVEAAIHINVDEAIVTERLLRRGQEQGRKDDNVETINHRLKVYEQQTAPLIEYYENQGLLAHIDGNGPSDAVFEAICQSISRGSLV